MWRNVLRFLSVAATLASVFWFYAQGGFEPVIAILTSLASVIALFLQRSEVAVGAELQPTPQQSQAALYRSDIERALDNLVSFENGSTFQSLSVILAKKRWPALIASERKWDHGLDALALPEMGLASSISATFSKIKADAQRARQSFPELKVIIFCTPVKVTNHTALKWKEELARDLNLQLVVISREDVIVSLMDPTNAQLCRSHLGLALDVAAPTRDSLTLTHETCAEDANNWFQRLCRLNPYALIMLDLVRRHDAEPAIQEAWKLEAVRQQLEQGRRVVLEGPPGSGKTTTLVQLATQIIEANGICVLVDLPRWIESGLDILKFVSQSPPYQARNIGAGDLAKLASTVHLDFLLNGWNEIAEDSSSAAGQALSALERDFPTAGVLLATRPHWFTPPLPGAWRVAIRELNTEQRRSYLTEALGSRSEPLLVQIAASATLDMLTRTPLILSEVARLCDAGRPIPATKLDILQAMAGRIEEAVEHRIAIQSPPLSGRAQSYLIALAVGMTHQGRVELADEEAKATIMRESAALQRGGQLVTLPEPLSILTALCAHHVLLRTDSPARSYRFQHQQFQEFYAALRILALLRQCVVGGDTESIRALQSDYINRPAWEEAITMVADAVGAASPTCGSSYDGATLGEHLVKYTLRVDPIFAADLVRRCSNEVWARTRVELAPLLRRWYAVDDLHHRRCALAAMMATGSDDFLDILLPLLTSPDQQTRLRSYRAYSEFHLSSLGPGWRVVLAGWTDEQRHDFVGELFRDSRSASLAEEYANTDPSQRVRVAAIENLRWMGADESLARVLKTLDGAILLEATSDGSDTDGLTDAGVARVIAALRARAGFAESAAASIAICIRLAHLGAPGAIDDLKVRLEGLSVAEARAFDETLLSRALKAVRAADAPWADAWIVPRIAEGLLWPERWIPDCGAAPTGLLVRTLTLFGAEEVDHRRLEGAIALIAKMADADVAERIWRQVYGLSIHTASNPHAEPERLRMAVRRQMEDLARALPPSLRVSAAIRTLSNPPPISEIEAILDVFGRSGDMGDLRSELSAEDGQSIHDLLVGAVPRVLQQDDFGGGLKASLALSLARVGRPHDVAHLRSIVRGDVDRLRAGNAARGRGVHSPQANGAMMSHANWYVQALRWLGPDAAEPVLLELLEEPEYERDAAAELTKLVFPEPAPGYGPLVLDAASSTSATEPAVDEQRRVRYAEAIASRINTLLVALAGADNPEAIASRIKALVVPLVRLDGLNSLDIALRGLALPGTWDGWKRVDALDALLKHHPRIPTEATLAILNPTIEHTISQGIYNDQGAYLLERCLCLLPFVADTGRGISRIREALTASGIGGYRLRSLVSALARSGTEEALEFLIELATGNAGFQYFAREWIAAVGSMPHPRAREQLLGVVDPGVTTAIRISPETQAAIAEKIAAIAESDPGIRIRVRELCDRSLSPAQREVLSEVVEMLGDSDTVLAGLMLVRDSASPPVPFRLERAIEGVLFERRPFRGSSTSYTLLPQSGAAVRECLVAMVKDDPLRRRSAFRLLGEIEELRLDSGRPPVEPRHPCLASGLQWPPLDVAVPG